VWPIAKRQGTPQNIVQQVAFFFVLIARLSGIGRTEGEMQQPRLLPIRQIQTVGILCHPFTRRAAHGHNQTALEPRIAPMTRI
jgi:hypothetical protein